MSIERCPRFSGPLPYYQSRAEKCLCHVVQLPAAYGRRKQRLDSTSSEPKGIKLRHIGQTGSNKYKSGSALTMAAGSKAKPDSSGPTAAKRAS